MTLDDVLGELIWALRATDKPYIINCHTAQSWPSEAMKALSQSGIITSAKQAETIQCRACENHCFEDVHIVAHKDKPTRAFVVCADPDMQEQMGRIQIPIEQLQQWKSSPLQFARVIARLIGIECKADYKHGQTNIRIGMIDGDKGRRWLSLNTSPLTIEINNKTAPLDEILFFENERLAIDENTISMLAKDTRQSTSKKYTPSIEDREKRKRNTEAMHEDWKKEYLRLSKKHPDKTASWISKQIEKQPIAQNRDSETIRKNMKP